MVSEALVSRDWLCIWEGAVRSGKTVIGLMAFASYVAHSPEKIFLLSGRTLGTVEKNCILGDFGLLALMPGARYGQYHAENAITFSVGTEKGTVQKVIYIKGASDIRAYMALRGNSYGGWFADEINMHDPEFVAEALRRTAVSRERRHFWTLNPDNPRHWIYTDYIDRYMAMSDAERKELGGVRLWKYRPEDNPAMTPQMLASLRAQYPRDSYQYRRYVLGERCVAEGVIYPMVAGCIEMPPDEVKAKYASIDFGAVHPTAMGWYGRDAETRTWYKVREWRATPTESERMTVSDYMDVFERICNELGHISRNNLTIDYGGGGEALAREAERRGWMPQDPVKDVIFGIEEVSRLLSGGRLKISPKCPLTIEEMEMYRWDDKASQRGLDKPLKAHDDLCDETRYAVTTFIAPRVKTTYGGRHE